MLQMNVASVLLGLTVEQGTAISSVCVGLCVLLLASFVFALKDADRHDEKLDYVELKRRNQLRAASPLYRHLEPAIESLSRSSLIASQTASHRQKAAAFASAAQSLSGFPPWQIEEYSAASFIAGLGVGAVFGAFVTAAFGWLAGAGAFFAAFLFYWHSQVASVLERAKHRSAEIKRRLPFAVDLMALVMESGASFLQALRTVTAESGDDPMGQELAKVLSRIDHGEVASVALGEFQQRVNDEDVRQLVDAINQGEKLGTPLATILRKQSDVIQIKSSQWVERAAKEAEVRMTGPGFVMAIACMVIIAAPFVLKATSMFF